MAWTISVDADFFLHPKTEIFQGLTGDSGGYVIRLWTWAAKFAKNGNLSKFTPEKIEKYLGWTGEQNVLWNALIESGYVEKKSKKIYNWMKHSGGKLAKYDNKLKTQRKKYKKLDTEKSSEILPQKNKNRQNSSAHRREEKRREEKRREEKNKHTEAGVLGEADSKVSDSISSLFEQTFTGTGANEWQAFIQDTQEYGEKEMRKALIETKKRKGLRYRYTQSILSAWKAKRDAPKVNSSGQDLSQFDK